ncbi:MAG: hypothetical protein KGJ55_07240 [Gammaproteobacteria bacterium]|nr:hypothetical protein [Gammaproteobacteria bacterium]
MKTAAYFLLFMAIAVLAIVIGIILGDVGAWYFAWLLGTVVIVLVAAAGAALLDSQEARDDAVRSREAPPRGETG